MQGAIALSKRASTRKRSKRRDPLPALEPMLATLVPRPFDDDAWSFEPKWDGVRALAVVEDDVRLITRNRKDVTIAYPELQEIKRRVHASMAVVDGEIVAFEDGMPSFQKLQGRMHVRSESQIAQLMKTIPVAYIVFDLIYLDGCDLTRRSYDERRDLLETHLKHNNTVQLSPAVVGEGTALFDAAREQHLEGIVAKLRTSRYEPGRRSKSWVKVKTVLEADVVIAGWMPGGGKYDEMLGSLVTAVYEDGRLRYTGSVGTGFSEKKRAELAKRLRPLQVSKAPFAAQEIKGKPELRRAHWVRPKLVAIVEFRQLTAAGRLRAPAFKGLRDDKSPKECTYKELRAAAGF